MSNTGIIQKTAEHRRKEKWEDNTREMEGIPLLPTVLNCATEELISSRFRSSA